jgi:hypothetical protein
MEQNRFSNKPKSRPQKSRSKKRSTVSRVASKFKIPRKNLNRYTGPLDGGHRFVDKTTGIIYGYNIF